MAGYPRMFRYPFATLRETGFEMKQLSLKLIFRSWWRNKVFAVISILSLAVGIACTNLLAAFVIHEYNVEAGNPNRDRIYCLAQDSPFQSGDEVFFASNQIPPMIKDRYPEVEDYLCLNSANVSQVTVGETIYEPITVLLAQPSLSRFFPCETLVGSLEDALSTPDKIALSEATARRFFGRENPVGKSIYVSHSPEEGTMYQVAAVLKEREQSILVFDAVTSLVPEYGGSSFFLMNQAIDPESFALRLKEDGIPTFNVDKGRYYLHTLQENFFKEYKAQTLQYLRGQHKLTLEIGLFSALLILLIACFNYINLNFSRLLQQVKMIRIQRIMGASRTDIRRQLFLDIFFTVMAGFLLSLLFMYGLIPFFNKILSGQMKASFIFSGQVTPFLCGLVLLLSILPAINIGRKAVSVSGQREIDSTGGGKKKRGLVSTLSVIQFAISIVLIIGTLTVNSQIGLIRQGGERYRGLIEVECRGENNKPFFEELRTYPELGKVNATGVSWFRHGVRQMMIPETDGSETYLTLREFLGDSAILSSFDVNLLQGMQPEEALRHYARPVYINRRFADVLVRSGENPVGQPLKSFDKDFDSKRTEDGSKENPVTTIAGVVENFFTGSLEEEISPALIHVKKETNELSTFSYVYFHVDRAHPERLALVEQLWEKHNPGRLFAYRNVYEDFISMNQKVFGMADLLLMYSLISIALTCFGLFGMALYATEQRTKEIGIRKVNGASTWQIMGLLNRQFAVWTGIACLFAIPAAWIMLNLWLESFVYRVDVSPWLCFLSGLIVLLITLLTVCGHSYRAASGNPVNVLRSE